MTEDFPSGPLVKNSLVSAKDMGSIPVLGGFHMPQSNSSHAPQLLSSGALEPTPINKDSAQPKIN